MLKQIPPIECVTSRESISARLDDELSELDAMRLEAHLRGCADCRGFARGVEAAASALRSAALERPEAAVFLPAGRRLPLVRVQTVAAAVALVAAAAGSSFVLGRALGTSASRVPTVPTAADAASVRADSTEQHLLAMLDRIEVVPARPGRLQAV